jgi:hypothetical protein
VFKKTLFVVAQAVSLLVATAAPGHAALFSGACTLEVTINFDSPVTMTDSNPGYSLTISGGTDLDSSRAGNQACVTSLDFVDPFRRTFGDGVGDSTTWTCTSAFSSGSWDQSWYDERGSGSPPPLTGTHTLIGTWNAWLLEVTSPSLNYVAVGELRVAPEHQGAITSACQKGGIRSLKLVGTLVFQDP